MSSILRYIRLYLHFLQFSFSRALEFRIDFFFRIVMDLFYYGINIAFYGILFSHIENLGGWNFDETLLFVSIFLLIDAINMTVFANNLWILPDLINKGELDYYLLRPVSPLFFVSLRDFAANSFVNLLAAGGIFLYALERYPGSFQAWQILLLGVMIVAGALLRYMLRLCFLIPTFWLHAGRGLDAVYFNLNRFIERPHTIFTGVARVVLTSILPFSLMASFPAALFFNPEEIHLLIHFIGVFIFFTLFVRFFWRKGLASYSSASS